MWPRGAGAGNRFSLFDLPAENQIENYVNPAKPRINARANDSQLFTETLVRLETHKIKPKSRSTPLIVILDEATIWHKS